MAYVYLIRQGHDDLYKIGSTTKHPMTRLKELQTGNPQELHLVSHYRTKHHQKIEMLMHIAHEGHKVRNEWFRFDLSMEDEFINECESKETSAKVLVEQDRRNKEWKDWLRKKT